MASMSRAYASRATDGPRSRRLPDHQDLSVAMSSSPLAASQVPTDGQLKSRLAVTEQGS